MKKLSIFFSLTLIGSFAIAQQTVPKVSPAPPIKPGTTTTVKAPHSTVAPAPAPTSNPAPTVNPAPVENEYAPGNEKQTNPTVTTAPKKFKLVRRTVPMKNQNSVQTLANPKVEK